MTLEQKYKCRTCLSENASKLFSWSTPLNDEENCEVTFMDCYRECTLLEANSDDQLPQAICCDCAEQMRDAYYFIKRAKESQKTLMLELENSSLVKTEFEWVTVDDGEDEKIITATPPSDQHSPPAAQIEGYKGSPPHKDCENQNNVPEKKLDRDFLENGEPNKDSQLSDTKSEKAPMNKNGRTRKKSPDTHPDNLVVCKICGTSIAKKDFASHRYWKHRPKTLLCDACPLVFKSRFDLQSHAQVHAKNRPRNFTCEKCGQKFMTKGCLQCHVKIHEPNRQPQFQCELCEKSFFYRGDLNEHKKVHTAERHECKICSKQYVRRIELKYHMERTHSGEMPFKCPNCEKAFKHRAALNKHLRFHDGTLYQCTVCSKEYASQSGLKNHRQVHSGLPFKCSICEKGFANKYKTKRHISSVHKVDEEEVGGLIIRLKATREQRIRIRKVL